MANALKAKKLGERYQAWLFWEQAAKLLQPQTHVTEVRFEEGVRAFDDIVVRFDPLYAGSYGEPLAHRSYQGKYHVASGHAFSLASLTDPALIGAERATLLSRLGEAYRTLGADDFGRGDYWLVSPSPLDPADGALHELWRENPASFRREVLLQGKRADSQWVNLRARWREATGAADDEELLAIVGRLRLGHAYGGSAERWATMLSGYLAAVGLKPIDPQAAVEPYGDIPWNLHLQDRTRYTRADIEQLADEYDLRIPAPAQPKGTRLGIRTRVEWGEEMGDQCAAVLPLEDQFQRRWLEPGCTWGDVYPRVRDFVRAHTRDGQRKLLEVAGPISVAFAAGHAVPTRDGRAIFPLQRRPGGIDLWEAVGGDPSAGGWQVHQDAQTGTGGSDIAIGLGVSREVWPSMAEYVQRALPEVGRLIEFHPPGGPSHASVRDAGHARHLAEDAEQRLRTLRRGNRIPKGPPVPFRPRSLRLLPGPGGRAPR